MKKFTLTMMTLGLVATLGLAGCGKQEKATTSSEKTEVTLPTKDRSGKEITLPKRSNQNYFPSAITAEVIEDLGKTDQLIAVDTQSSTMMTDLKITTNGYDGCRCRKIDCLETTNCLCE